MNWSSNSPKLYKKFAEQDYMKETITKVLRLQWNTVTDQLMIDTKKFDNSMTARTKKQVVITIASLFDTLGYLMLTTMKLRLFLQNLWIHEKG